MRVKFSLKGQTHEAERLRRGKKSDRVGWSSRDVPLALAGEVEASSTRLGWMTMLLPTVGPKAVTVEDVPYAYTMITKRQIDWATRRGIRLQKGALASREEPLYTQSLDENLFERLSAEATAEYQQGDGTPLLAKGGRLPHFWALHNSDAIAANVFDYWKLRDPGHVAGYLGIPRVGIASLHFERKFRILPRGTRPNIDVAIKYDAGSQYDWVGIESKLTETYPAARRKLFDDKYFASGPWWDGLPATRQLAESFRGDGRKLEAAARHLDRGQLIKHLLGLRHACRQNGTALDRVMLMYLWYEVDSPEARQHEREVNDFAAVLAQDGAAFVSMTWQALIGALAQGERSVHGRYVEYLTERYL